MAVARQSHLWFRKEGEVETAEAACLAAEHGSALPDAVEPKRAKSIRPIFYGLLDRDLVERDPRLLAQEQRPLGDGPGDVLVEPGDRHGPQGTPR